NGGLNDLKQALETAKTTLSSQVSQVGERQNSLEGQLQAIRGRLDFSPSSNLAPKLKEKLEDGVTHFIVYFTEIGFKGVSDQISVHVFSEKEPLKDELAISSKNPNAFYMPNTKTLYIHQSMADDLSVALIEYMHYSLDTLPGGHSLSSTDIYYGLSDYF